MDTFWYDIIYVAGTCCATTVNYYDAMTEILEIFPRLISRVNMWFVDPLPSLILHPWGNRKLNKAVLNKKYVQVGLHNGRIIFRSWFIKVFGGGWYVPTQKSFLRITFDDHFPETIHSVCDTSKNWKLGMAHFCVEYSPEQIRTGLN